MARLLQSSCSSIGVAVIFVNLSLLRLTGASFSPFPPEAAHKCYFISGDFDPRGGPCYGNVGASMCCYSGEKCVEGSGLCLTPPNGTPGPNDNGTAIWRRSCTDQKWQDKACMGIAYGSSTTSAQLTACNDGTFCPRTATNQNLACCDKHQGQTAILGSAVIPAAALASIRNPPASSAGAPVMNSAAPQNSPVTTPSPQSAPAPKSSQVSSSSTSSQTPSSSAVRTSSSGPTSASSPKQSSLAQSPSNPPSDSSISTPTPATAIADASGKATASSASNSSNSDDKPSSVSSGAKVGIGIGVGIGVLLIAILSFIFARRRKTKKDQLLPAELPGSLPASPSPHDFTTFYGKSEEEKVPMVHANVRELWRRDNMKGTVVASQHEYRRSELSGELPARELEA